MMKRIFNKKRFKLIPIILSLLVLVGAFAACSKKEETQTTQAQITTAVTQTAAQTKDVDIDLEGATKVTLNDTSIRVDGSGAKAEGSTLIISSGGTYLVSGMLKDGSIVVDADGEEVNIALNGADITCSSSSAIYVYEAKAALLYLVEGSSNTLSDGSTYTYKDSYSNQTEEEPNACLYAKDDLTIAGSGALKVTGNYNNGIVSKDTLSIESCSLSVTANNNGINGKDSLSIQKATVSVTANGDALRSTNDTDSACGSISIASSTVKIDADEDGIQAQTDISISGGKLTLETGDDGIHAANNVQIASGTLSIQAGDDGIHADNTMTIDGGTFTISAREGLEGTVVTMNDGTMTIDASDDGINAGQKVSGVTPTVTINGGKLTITMAQGDTDGIDSNGDIIVNGGTVDISGQSGFDYDGKGELNGGTVTVNGEKQTELVNQFAGGMGGGPGDMQGGMGGPGGM
ncbi:MAG: carbohydrate-binding domain-containing protein [Clostridia bacterium]|nr:carbohydrate-binding domain-containing protein [Clostridia bacterium]